MAHVKFYNEQLRKLKQTWTQRHDINHAFKEPQHPGKYVINPLMQGRGHDELSLHKAALTRAKRKGAITLPKIKF